MAHVILAQIDALVKSTRIRRLWSHELLWTISALHAERVQTLRNIFEMLCPSAHRHVAIKDVRTDQDVLAPQTCGIMIWSASMINGVCFEKSQPANIVTAKEEMACLLSIRW